MVGILLALQVNNWNQKRLNKETEVAILDEITKNLYTGVDWVSGGLNTDNRSIEACRIVINHISNKLPYNDSLLRHFFMISNYGYIGIPMSGYHSFNERNSSIIQNDSIRSGMSDIFEVHFLAMEKILMDVDTRKHGFLNSELYKHFKLRISDMDDGKFGREANNMKNF